MELLESHEKPVWLFGIKPHTPRPPSTPTSQTQNLTTTQSRQALGRTLLPDINAKRHWGEAQCFIFIITN
jgi:hypothetical protein